MTPARPRRNLIPTSLALGLRPSVWVRWIIAVAAVIFVWTRRADLLASVGVLAELRLAPALLAIALSVVAILNRGAMNRAAHRAVGLRADLPSMTRVSAAAYALNKVVKTGGVGGIALFVRHGEARKRPAGTVTAAYILVSSCTQVALFSIVLVAVAGASLTGSLAGVWVAGAAVGAIVCVASLTALVYGARRIETVRLLYGLPHRMISALSAILGRPAPAPPSPTHANHFHAAALSVRDSPNTVLPVFAHAVTAKLLGAGVLAASLAATGASISVTNALMVYALALIAATVGILPGGIGAVEASMTAILSSFGIAAPIAIAAVLTFRVLDLWFPLGVGLVAARGLNRMEPPAREAAERLCAVGAGSPSLSGGT